MVQQSVVVQNKTGLHARPASELFKLCASYPCSVDIVSGGKTYSAKHIMGILMAGITKGTEITVQTEGEQEEEALEHIISFLANLKE